MKELTVVGVRVEHPANQPVLLLREKDGDRVLPIWIAAPEATAIAYELEGVRPPRPLTHDLLKEVLAEAGLRLEKVTLTGVEAGIFRSALALSGGRAVDARPSDAVALALRAQCPIYATEELLNEVGIPDVPPSRSRDELEAFRAFLDNVDPADFGECSSP